MGIVSKWNNHGIFLLKSENLRRLINLTPHHLNDKIDDYLVDFLQILTGIKFSLTHTPPYPPPKENPPSPHGRFNNNNYSYINEVIISG